MRVLWALLAIAVWFATPVQAEVADVYDFSSRSEEQRFQQLISELRCPKCQNQNIADSNAPISEDMRNEVYRMMQDGASNEEIVDALVARFGEFIQYKPPVDQRTILLWAFPAIAAIGGFLIVVGGVWRTRRREAREQGLTDEDRSRAERILSGDQDDQASH